jgi:hypothetical protein
MFFFQHSGEYSGDASVTILVMPSCFNVGPPLARAAHHCASQFVSVQEPMSKSVKLGSKHILLFEL